MKYKIEVNGRGAEAFLFELTEETHQYLKDNGIEDDEMSYDDIIEALNVDDITQTEHLFSGVYLGSDNIHISVLREDSNELVWESDDHFEFEEEDFDYQFSDGHYLYIEDYQKGNFLNYTLETEEEFNPSLLSSKIIEFLDGKSLLLTDIKYDGVEMINYGGDTISKGFTYILSDLPFR